MARRSRKFTPYRPPTPPASLYDPALDSQEAAARRGLGDLQQQIGTAQARDVTDYAVAQGDLQRQAQQSLDDFGLAGRRGFEDYQRNIGLLTRKYNNLAQSQTQQANVAGVLRGGALMQQLAKRTAAGALERQDLDTNYSRFVADQARQSQRQQEGVQSRLGQLALDYAPPDASNPLGGRRYQDRTTQLTQAQRENAFFGQDIARQRVFQANAAGWDPAQRPANEFTNAQGQAYRVVREGNRSVAYDPTGRVLWRRPYRGG